MEQGAVIHFFMLKGLKAKDIHAELESVFGLEALALVIMKKWCRLYRQERTNLFDDFMPERPLTHDLTQAIRFALETLPFHSCKILHRHFQIRNVTYLRIFDDNLGLKQFIIAGFHTVHRLTTG
jgi:hypothetical protein